MKKLIKENLIKNLLVIIIIPFFFSPIYNYINKLSTFNNTILGNLLSIISIISVIVCFGNFAFTYEKVNSKKILQRYLAHTTTGIFMFLIGISLFFIDIIISYMSFHSLIIDFVLIMIYISCMGYDIWDVLRMVDND